MRPPAWFWRRPPAAPSPHKEALVLLRLLGCLLLLGRHFNRPPFPQRCGYALSKKASLAPCATGRLARTSEPFFELFAWDPPDAADADRRDPRRIRVIDPTETAQDRRRVDAEPPRYLFGREELLF